MLGASLLIVILNSIYFLIFIMAILNIPVILGVVLFYISELILYCFKKRYTEKFSENLVLRDLRLKLAKFWNILGLFLNQYDIVGFENIPESGPALLIIYHPLSLDIFFLWAKCILLKKRTIKIVTHRLFLMVPGLKLFIKATKIFSGSFETCVNELKAGHLVLIAPGGDREALITGEYYNIVWKNRIGFAKVALKAQVPIIPVFTANINEAIRKIKFVKSLSLKFYEKFNLSYTATYGIFPVKLRTHIGRPIEFDPTITPKKLALKTSLAVEDLIIKNQRIPGNILRALKERIVNKEELPNK